MFAVALLLLLAGCGGGEDAAPPPRPAIERAVAQQLAQTSDAIAAALDQGDVCTAAGLADDLNAQVIEAINARRIPAAFQEDLQARANELVNEVNCPPPPEEQPEEQQDKDKKDDKAEKDEKEKKEEEKTDEEQDGEGLPLPLPTITVGG